MTISRGSYQVEDSIKDSLKYMRKMLEDQN